eukprot:FR739854.1.p3 GENE.FR739854.1~~FR739854.1.p3  ORF type:complete len:125 (+),score=29.92 FR739854.1:713-1087(+)
MLNHLLLFLRPVVPRQVQWETFRSCLELLRDFRMHMNRDKPPYVKKKKKKKKSGRSGVNSKGQGIWISGYRYGWARGGGAGSHFGPMGGRFWAGPRAGPSSLLPSQKKLKEPNRPTTKTGQAGG